MLLQGIASINNNNKGFDIHKLTLILYDIIFIKEMYLETGLTTYPLYINKSLYLDTTFLN